MCFKKERGGRGERGPGCRRVVPAGPQLQAEPWVQAGPHRPGVPRAPALTSRVLCGNTSLPPLKTFAGAARFGETPPELLAQGVLGCRDSSAGGSFATFPPMSAKDRFGPALPCGSLAWRCLPSHRSVPQFPSPPPPGAVAEWEGSLQRQEFANTGPKVFWGRRMQPRRA